MPGTIATEPPCTDCTRESGHHAGLHVGHVWTNVQCPAYRTQEGADCTCAQPQLTPWALARLANCADPDSPTSPGARLLLSVAEDVAERIRDSSCAGDCDHDGDTAAEIAGGAVPVYTSDVWAVFTDLAAYREDVGDFGPVEHMTKAATLALYAVGQRLASALLAGAR